MTVLSKAANFHLQISDCVWQKGFTCWREPYPAHGMDTETRLTPQPYPLDAL